MSETGTGTGTGTGSELQPMNYLDQEQLRRMMANWKLTPATYAQKISRGTWIPSPHLQYIALRIAKALAKGNARIILSMPPRHGKSQLLSIYTPAWILEYLKKKNIILACYGADLAEGFARQVRRIIADPNNHPLQNVRIGDLARAEEFNTNLGGYMYAVGLGGAITGRGADVLLIDDYIKEIKEALSPAYRDYIWNWYVTTALTRLEPNGSVCIIATRWHSDDLIGRLLQHERQDWEYIEMPAIALENDIIHRRPGEALFPERYPIDKLLSLRKSLGTVFFESLFQQRPVDETMQITDTTWVKYWSRSRPLPMMKLCRIWDLAATEGGGDWLTGTLCGYEEASDTFIILHVFRDQLGPGRVEAAVAACAEADGPGVRIGIEQEPGSAGKILVEHFINNVLKGYKTEKVLTGGKAKVIRAQPFLAACEAGGVYMLTDIATSPAKWNKLFLDEFETFPSTNKAIHDDMIDTAAEGYSMLTGRRSLSVAWAKSDTLSGPNGKAVGALGRNPKGTRNSVKLQDAQKQYSAGISVRPRITSGATWGSRTKSNDGY
jgi:predicted phage terminase large subunit-like protein